MNKILSTPLKKYIFQKYNFLSFKHCTFARLTKKPTINRVFSELEDNIHIQKDSRLDLDEITQGQNTDKHNFEMNNVDEMFEKDQIFSQKERHTMNSKKTSAKDAEKEEANSSLQQYSY